MVGAPHILAGEADTGRQQQLQANTQQRLVALSLAERLYSLEDTDAGKLEFAEAFRKAALAGR